MQVDPIKPTLEAPGCKRLKLQYVKLLSNFAFNFNLRRYSAGAQVTGSYVMGGVRVGANATVSAALLCEGAVVHAGRGLHSPTSQLNLSGFGQCAVLCPGCDEP